MCDEVAPMQKHKAEALKRDAKRVRIPGLDEEID
jgi:hypothetical protein